jgi:hypothetical protein
VTDSLQSPLRRQALALHQGAARLHRLFATPGAELVLVTNLGIAILGAGLVWLQFDPPLRTLLVAAGALYIVLFAMLLRADTAVAVGVVGGLIAAGWSALLTVGLVARWSLVAGCCLGAYVAVEAFILTLRAYHGFSAQLRAGQHTPGSA